MAQTTPLSLFIGTDQAFVFHILNSAAAAERLRNHEPALAADEAVDMSGWSLHLMVKRHLADADAAALLAIASLPVSGVFSAAPSTNLQRATATLTDTQTAALPPCLAYWELKRTDDGYEAVLADGRMQIKRAVHVS